MDGNDVSDEENSSGCWMYAFHFVVIDDDHRQKKAGGVRSVSLYIRSESLHLNSGSQVGKSHLPGYLTVVVQPSCVP